MNHSISILKRFEKADGILDVVLDTDAYNEIDDQFAISLLLKSPERVNIRAFYAAPFFNEKSTGPEDGMEKSYDEILKLLKLAGETSYESVTFKGSRRYLPDENTPVDSEAARDLSERAMAYSSENPLYVLAIGAITNVASAILMKPEIADRIVLVWLGGNALHWPDNREFNLMQDVAAARVVMNSRTALVVLPCAGVVTELRTTKPELTYWLKGKNPLADYLAENTIKEADSYALGKPWSRVIWDISAVFWLLDKAGEYMKSRIVSTPVPEYDDRFACVPDRHPMLYVYSIDRDAVFEHLFMKLS